MVAATTAWEVVDETFTVYIEQEATAIDALRATDPDAADRRADALAAYAARWDAISLAMVAALKRGDERAVATALEAARDVLKEVRR